MATEIQIDPLTGPAAFAEIVEGALFTRIPAFDAARQRFLTAHPEFRTARIGGPWVEMGKAGVAAMLAAFCRGIKIGVATEYLRSVVAPSPSSD